MSLGRTATLPNGCKLPLLGYGTWLSKPGEVEDGVFKALEVGYRHLDLAKIYRNQHEVARGLKRALAEIPGLKREDIFITSKLWNTQHHPDVVEDALDDCLEELGLEYLDLYLIHFPVSFQHQGKIGENLLPRTDKEGPDGVHIDDSISIIDTWRAMIQLPASKTKAVGVSNFTEKHLEAITQATGIAPAVCQVERHPMLPQHELIEYCYARKILVSGYSPFGNNMYGIPLIVNHPDIRAIAGRCKATPAQVLLAWAQVGGNSVISKSVTPSRIAENFKEIELTPRDVNEVGSIFENAHRRYNIPYCANSPRWDINIFQEEEEIGATHRIII